MAHPCTSGPNNSPCNRAIKGRQFDINTECRLCWLYLNDIRYYNLWTETAAEAAVSGEPNLLQKAVNFTKAVATHVATGFQLLSDEEKQKRLEICKQCDYCDKERMVCKHTTCGCYLNIKAGWNSTTCPLNKWPAIPMESQGDGDGK